ncbi:B12-binding domain-containing protein [Bacteroidota bacterium]
MSELLEKISKCVESGKINRTSPFPPSMKDQDGADELTKKAIDQGIAPEDILSKGLVPGMEIIGIKFRENKVFVPEVLMAAKAMSAAMNHLKPFFQSGDLKRKGTMIIGTVQGDLHDIGKNLVAMMIEGAGWKVIDLGVDAGPEKFIEKIDENPSCTVGLSALLTTTMVNMENIVSQIKSKYPDVKVLVGGAPLTQQFCDNINADFYSPDPQGAVEYLNAL